VWRGVYGLVGKQEMIHQEKTKTGEKRKEKGKKNILYISVYIYIYIMSPPCLFVAIRKTNSKTILPLVQ
jgi:hypothetical protein